MTNHETVETAGNGLESASDRPFLNFEDRYAVAEYGGVAFYYDGPETKPDEDTEWSGIENETGMVRMVMVGDDRVHIIDPDDVSVIADEDYCSGCGQIGCGWG